MRDIDDPSLSGYGDGWALPCPECRDPLAEDGSCGHCGTVACHGCGEVFPGAVLVDVTEQGRTVRCCPECAADSDGVPEPIDADTAEAQTVRLPREPIGAEGLGEVLAERGRQIAAARSKLSAAVA